MIKKTNYIFSDERGSWNTPKDIYYVRAWLKINSDDYLKLKNEYENRLEVYGIKKDELKWKNKGTLIDYPDIASRIFNQSSLEFFISFSILKEFYERKINPREYLFEVLEKMEFQDDSRQDYLQRIPDKIKSSINYLLFLNIYERYHAWNAFERFVTSSQEDYYIFVDKPQFLEKDFYELLGNTLTEMFPERRSTFKKKIVNSKEHLGVQLADIVAGCYYTLLKSSFLDLKCFTFFKEFVKQKLVAKGNIALGINKVMYNKEDAGIELIKYIKSKLS